MVSLIGLIALPHNGFLPFFMCDSLIFGNNTVHHLPNRTKIALSWHTNNLSNDSCLFVWILEIVWHAVLVLNFRASLEQFCAAKAIIDVTGGPILRSSSPFYWHPQVYWLMLLVWAHHLGWGMHAVQVKNTWFERLGYWWCVATGPGYWSVGCDISRTSFSSASMRTLVGLCLQNTNWHFRSFFQYTLACEWVCNISHRLPVVLRSLSNGCGA